MRTVAQNFALSFSAQHVLTAVQIDSDGDIDRFFHNLTLTANVVVDCIHEFLCIDALQGPALPLPDDGQHLIRDSADGRIRHVQSVFREFCDGLLEQILDVRHAADIAFLQQFTDSLRGAPSLLAFGSVLP